ncbi:hypothetical protein [Deinococcus sp. Leaf326]|uniref:hypothetical protein n=1 Tax=Deinococcus sp. Leaf326 TaxID=1736338 RepID=UPI000A54F00E|nr:hypothetical protein [Deinococcus sp. Leaf326]
MNDAQERQLHETLERMEATQLTPYRGGDISQLIRRLIGRQNEAHYQLQRAIQELHQVADLLRDQQDQPTPKAREARQQIAENFAQGAKILERAYDELIDSTQDLDYLRYKFL